MSFTATVEKGTIKLPPDIDLPDGTAVRVEPLKDPLPKETFAEHYAEFIGLVKGGPGDRADNHDHYLYGTPKRVP